MPPCFDVYRHPGESQDLKRSNSIQDFNASYSAPDTRPTSLSPKRLTGPIRFRIAMPDFQRIIAAL